MDVIVTGFEPFGGSETNASWEAVRLLTGVRTLLLPVSFARAADIIRETAALRPDAIICVGEAGGRSSVSVERVAVNIKDAHIPDNDGARPVDEPVRAGGPAAYFSTLPTRTIADRAREAGIPAALSYTAGTYVCNSTFYALMDAIAQGGLATRGGFIHVPAAGMEPETAARALRIAIEAIERG